MAEQRGLDGRVAVVTGGHSGIGYYISEALAGAGMRVVILGRRQAVLDRAAAALGHGVVPVACDIRDADSVRNAFGQVAERFGSLAALVNNAAIFPIYKIAEATDEELHATVETNLLGVLYCIRAAVPLMTDGGDVISVSSESVMNPFPYLNGYAATKAAVETLSRGLKSELRPLGIRVGVLRSGRVEVPDREGSSWDPERAQAFFAEAQAGGHLAMAGEGIDPRTTAAAVLGMLRQPANASVDLLELRSS